MLVAFSDKIYLIDVDTVLDTESGKNKIKIVHETMVYADKQDVGMNEYYSAIGANITLFATYEIPAEMYHGEKYILSEDRKKQYEIYRVGKGRTPAYRRLPVRAVQNRKQMIEGVTSG